MKNIQTDGRQAIGKTHLNFSLSELIMYFLLLVYDLYGPACSKIKHFRNLYQTSTQLKAQVSFCDSLLSVVCLSVCLLTFHISILSRTTGLISNKLGKNHPWVVGIQDFSIEGPRPFPRRDNYKTANIYLKILKIFFSRTTRPISTKLGTKHPWVMGIEFVFK